MLEELKDSWYIKRYLNGDLKAFDKLYAKYKNDVYGFIASLIKEKSVVDDIFQETFIKMIRSLELYREQNSFRSWLFAIAHNLCRDYWRKTKTYDTVDDFSDVRDVEPMSVDLDELIYFEDLSWLRSAVEMLPIKLRTVVVMHVYSELSFKEIAALLECSINTVLGRMHYAKQRLIEARNDYEKA